MKHSAIYLAIALGLCLSACTKKGEKPKEQAVYKTMIVETRDVDIDQAYTARLTGRQIVEVRPQVSGNIMQICIKEGDNVKKGQTLFIIDQAPFRAALDLAIASRKSAEAKLATAKMNYESETSLKESNVVSDFSVKTMHHQLLEAEAALAGAKAQEANARNELSYTVVKSPVNGVASMIPWHVGSLVSSSIAEPLVTVADDSEMLAYFSITENQAIALLTEYGSMDAFIRESPAVALRLSNGTVYPEKGRIDAVSGTVDTSTGAVTLRATFPNPHRLLHNGGSGSVVITTAHKGSIVVPQEATYELQNRVFVYKVVDGKTKATAVTLSPQNNGREYIVEEGLQPGDTIIAEGAGLVKEGAEIKSEKVKR